MSEMYIKTLKKRNCNNLSFRAPSKDLPPTLGTSTKVWIRSVMLKFHLSWSDWWSENSWLCSQFWCKKHYVKQQEVQYVRGARICVVSLRHIGLITASHHSSRTVIQGYCDVENPPEQICKSEVLTPQLLTLRYRGSRLAGRVGATS